MVCFRYISANTLHRGDDDDNDDDDDNNNNNRKMIQLTDLQVCNVRKIGCFGSLTARHHPVSGKTVLRPYPNSRDSGDSP
jgi:hypothetical protein